MPRRLISFTALLALSLNIPAARADGLIYQLPADRSSARFELEFTANREGNLTTSSRSLRVRSVGKSFEGADECRWIEFKMQMDRDGQQQTIVAKALIPEKHLKRGQTPADHIVRVWLKEGQDETQQLEDISSPRAGPLPAFLAGPFQDQKKLDKVAVEVNGLGKLECPGLTGRHQFTAGQNEIHLKYQTRLHEKAPFGVVSCRIDYQVMRDSQVRQSGHMTLKLMGVGTDAESDLPGYQ